MKASTFENLIRKVVREEIDYSLRREIKSLKEDLRDELKPTIVEHTKSQVEVPQEAKSSLREKIMGTQPIKQRPPQNYTSNSSLNDLLNETAQGDTNTQTAMAPSVIDETANMPNVVADAVTRDYSGLMKAIAKKKGR
jgi:hypothetical protein|tara:strand:+ start:3911 stop:4324 length:414 start_codon:yes stop_codon:yes gene_type:complete